MDNFLLEPLFLSQSLHNDTDQWVVLGKPLGQSDSMIIKYIVSSIFLFSLFYKQAALSEPRWYMEVTGGFFHGELFGESNGEKATVDSNGFSATTGFGRQTDQLFIGTEVSAHHFFLNGVGQKFFAPRTSYSLGFYMGVYGKFLPIRGYIGLSPFSATDHNDITSNGVGLRTGVGYFYDKYTVLNLEYRNISFSGTNNNRSQKANFALYLATITFHFDFDFKIIEEPWRAAY